ncbi:serine/arginine repetitive matrix protein 1 [Sabethes cyaneus]|uniref:serine/arginine repetitive matrix protein 1 n=1 Tax=Sabethes cyaneus TaxID=53552 RepID=UPI00237D5D76|nr:serine/arginine repetitive matrix protein 1 [Sabethes cyaneus]
MGKSKKKYESSSSSSSSDVSDSSDSSSSDDVEIKRRNKKKKSSGGGGGSSSRKHKKTSGKGQHASSGTELDSASEQSSDEEAKAAQAAAAAKKKHKKHKKQKKAKKHKKHKSHAASEDEKHRADLHDDEDDEVEEIIEEVVPDRRHRTKSADHHRKDRDYGSSRDTGGDRRAASPAERGRSRGRDRSGTRQNPKIHSSSKWDSPADGDYRRKRSHSPRDSGGGGGGGGGNFRHGGQRGNYDDYRKAPRSPPPRDSPVRADYDRSGRAQTQHRSLSGRGGGSNRYEDRRSSPHPPPAQQERRWGGGGDNRYDDDRHGGNRRDDFRKPSPRRRFGEEEQRFEGNRRGGSHHYQQSHAPPRERYDDYSGRDRNPRDRFQRGGRDDYEDRGGGPPQRRRSSPMGAPPQRGGRDRSPMQQDFRSDFGNAGGRGGGYRDRYDGPAPQSERGRFPRRGSFNRGGRGGDRGGRRGGGFGGGSDRSFGSDREMDHRRPMGGGWGHKSQPPSPRGSPSRSRSRDRDEMDRNGGNRGRGGRDSPPPIKVERRGPSSRSRSRSPIGDRRTAAAPLPHRPRKFPRKDEKEDGDDYEWGGKRKQPIKREQGFQRGSSEESGSEKKPPPEEKEKPNFALSGKLTEEANKVNGVVIKYAEPAESRKPKRRWRLYPFKGEQALPTLYIHRQSCYLIGRDRKVCDLPIDHPSCSKQHAALQYRLVPYDRDDGTTGKRVRPYIIDLESANGTFVNNKKIETKKFVELLEKDVLKFGFSSREYVLLHENSKEDEEDDDVVDDKGGAGGGTGAASNGNSRAKRESSE